MSMIYRHIMHSQLLVNIISVKRLLLNNILLGVGSHNKICRLFRVQFDVSYPFNSVRLSELINVDECPEFTL